MSKKSRRRNRMLAAMVGLAGASKLGLLSKSPIGKSGVYDAASKARKVGMKAKPLTDRGMGMLKEATTKLAPGINPKSIRVSSDGTIRKGTQVFKDKAAYAKAMAEKRAAKTPLTREGISKKTPGIFGFRFKEPFLSKGKMVKARGGGMAMRQKPTKLY
ncbi:hypothetical protein [Hyphomonas sp.]|uniref:hypothetical protein n=1 Tax=Hyphomonas sp. TaxID=87 RepID=UPI000C8FBBAC|nr:hypothetical protein [Hyphomonas sp.]MAL45982.1 hypothetical protein [Hyphomonas sp.]